MARTKWFQHPDSGQIFEAEGRNIKRAIKQGCKEVPPPKPKALEPTGNPTGDKKEGDKGAGAE